MHDALVAQHLAVQDQLEIPLLTGKVDNIAVTMLSLSHFAQLRSAILQAHPGLTIPIAPPLSAHQAHVYVPVDNFVRPQLAQSLPLSADHTLQLHIGSAARSFQVDQGNVRVINQDEAIADKVVVVNDQVYAQMQQTVSSAQQWHLYSFHFPNAQQTLIALQILPDFPGWCFTVPCSGNLVGGRYHLSSLRSLFRIVLWSCPRQLLQACACSNCLAAV